MSGFKPERDGEPEPSFNSRDNGAREDVRSPEANPADSSEERRGEEEDDGWREAEFVIHEEDDGWREAEFVIHEEDDGWRETEFVIHEEENDQQMPAEPNSHEDEKESRNWRMNRPRLDGQVGKGTRRRCSRIQPRNNFNLKWDRKPRCPENLRGKQIGLWYRENRPILIHKEHSEVIVSLRTQNFIRKLLYRTCGNKYFRLSKSKVKSHKVKNFQGKTAKSEAPGEMNNKKSCNFLTQAWEFGKEEVDEISTRAIERDADLDAQFYKELIEKKEIRNYNEMCAFRETLPAHKMKGEIVQLIKENKVCFISGGTGCGKTTQIVQFVLDDYILNMNGSLCNIVCTQPRRVSTFSIAERIAAERFEPLSHSVGYQIRFENKLSERKVGCINFVTTGVLLQWMVTNPILPQISHIFLDEVHEKTIEFDTIMALIKDMIQKRSDVKVILMSATTDVSSFCDYFGGAPDLEIPGYTFPVEEFYLDDVITMTDYKPPKKEVVRFHDSDYEDLDDDFPCQQNLVRHKPFLMPEEIDVPLIAHVIKYICLNQGDGSVLVFLPGFYNIMKLKKKIEYSSWYSPQEHLLLVAHSMLPLESQAEMFVTPPEGQRKIILATSIMETSVTLDDMTYVIDSGKIKCCSFDTNLNVSTLDTVWISMANVSQRRGRAGRTKPGKCFKLYTKEQEQSFAPYPRSDVQMNTLQYIILETKLLKIDELLPFMKKMMHTPDPLMVEAALRDLRRMSALDGENRLTALGYHLARLPMDAQTGKMVLMGAFFSCIDPIFSIAACLSYKDPFNVALDDHSILRVKHSYTISEKSDHMIFCDILKDWEKLSPGERTKFCSEKCLSESTLTRLSDMKIQFAKVLCGMNFLSSPDVKDPTSNVNSKNVELIKAILCAGLYPSMATLLRRTACNGVITLDGQFAVFHGKSYLSEVRSFDMPFFVYHHKLKTGTKVYLHDASMIEILPLLLFSETFDIVQEDHGTFVYINDKLNFKMGSRIADFLKGIKTRLDEVIGQALLNKEGFDWRKKDKNTAFLRGVVDLITNCQITLKIRNPF